VFTDRERLDNLDDFAELTTKDITDLTSKFERRTVADGRIIIPAKVLKNIQALCFWARDKVRAGQPLVGFTPAELTSVKETMRLRQEDSGTTPSIKPDKFDPAKWRDWHKVNGTSGYTWISPYDRAQNGRLAWNALTDHYEGGGQREKRTTAALAALKALHYKNESIFPFEDFSRKLIRAFQDLAGTPEDITDFTKVKMLLEKTEVTLPRAEVAKSHIRQNFRSDLEGAIEYLGTEFTDMFADAIQYKRGRARGIAQVERDHQRPRYEDAATPDRNADGTTTVSGIDVSNVGRTFTRQEMSDLGSRGRSYIFQERQRLHLNRSGRGSGRGGRGGGRYGGRGGRGDNQRQINATTTGTGNDDMSAITNSTGVSLPPPPINVPQPPANEHNRGPSNGSNFGAGAYRE
jgi:hypothetical protein